MKLNRRHAILSAAALTASYRLPAAALDVDLLTSTLFPLIEALPGGPDPRRGDFPTTTGRDELIAITVPGEVPDMAWDPFGMDIRLLLGLLPSVIRQRAQESGESPVEVWTINTAGIPGDAIADTLISHGWELQDVTIPLLRYASSNSDRAELVEQLHVLNATIRDGAWDCIAIVPDWALVFGSDEELVRQTAHFMNHRAIADNSLRDAFYYINYLLPPTTFDFLMTPGQELGVSNAHSIFASRSFPDAGKVVHSIGIRLVDKDDVPATIELIKEQLASKDSTLQNAPFADFLEIVEVREKHDGFRIDFHSTTYGWNIVSAIAQGDLGLLPIN